MIGLVVIMFSVGIYLTITDRDDSDKSSDFWTGFHWFMNSLFNDKLLPIITTRINEKISIHRFIGWDLKLLKYRILLYF